MIDLLRKSWVALLFFGGALYAQIPHAAYVFACSPYLGRVCPASAPDDQLSHVYAYAVEGATLIFVVHRKRIASYGFAVASFLVNLCYYSMTGVHLFTWVALPSWLISALLPCAIAGYSHIAADVKDDMLGVRVWAQSYIERGKLWLASWQPITATQPVAQLGAIAPDNYMPTIVESEQAQLTQAIIDKDMPAQLDDMNQRIVDAIRNGAHTHYAIHKATSIALTTLKRKQGDKISGRLSQLVAMGIIRNSSGADGSEYRLAE